MDKRIKVRVMTGDGDAIAKITAKVPMPYRTKAEPDSAAEVYATGYADGAADTAARLT